MAHKTKPQFAWSIGAGPNAIEIVTYDFNGGAVDYLTCKPGDTIMSIKCESGRMILDKEAALELVHRLARWLSKGTLKIEGD